MDWPRKALQGSCKLTGKGWSVMVMQDAQSGFAPEHISRSGKGKSLPDQLVSSGAQTQIADRPACRLIIDKAAWARCRFIDGVFWALHPCRAQLRGWRCCEQRRGPNKKARDSETYSWETKYSGVTLCMTLLQLYKHRMKKNHRNRPRMTPDNVASSVISAIK